MDPQNTSPTRIPKIISFVTLSLALIILTISGIQAMLNPQKPIPMTTYYPTPTKSFPAPTLVTPFPTPTPSPQVEAKIGYFVYVQEHGGLCRTGVCSSDEAITADGAVLKNGTEVKKLSQTEMESLQQLIKTTDFATIKATPFTGTCPTAIDGSETTYTIATNGKAETLPNCTYQINTSLPLFRKLDEIFKK